MPRTADCKASCSARDDKEERLNGYITGGGRIARSGGRRRNRCGGVSDVEFFGQRGRVVPDGYILRVQCLCSGVVYISVPIVKGFILSVLEDVRSFGGSKSNSRSGPGLAVVNYRVPLA
ncbi:unnamed protein product [Nezara viridula]|uniref:Uncharacterized protein n=1 Tax=Nezara viridula TaxID=85310 RepID=A0A9P0HF22_NEZVI|nr:unnamed protein product [Nezara viridula]